MAIRGNQSAPFVFNHTPEGVYIYYAGKSADKVKFVQIFATSVQLLRSSTNQVDLKSCQFTIPDPRAIIPRNITTNENVGVLGDENIYIDNNNSNKTPFYGDVSIGGNDKTPQGTARSWMIDQPAAAYASVLLGWAAARKRGVDWKDIEVVRAIVAFQTYAFVNGIPFAVVEWKAICKSNKAQPKDPNLDFGLVKYTVTSIVDLTKKKPRDFPSAYWIIPKLFPGEVDPGYRTK